MTGEDENNKEETAEEAVIVDTEIHTTPEDGGEDESSDEKDNLPDNDSGEPAENEEDDPQDDAEEIDKDDGENEDGDENDDEEGDSEEVDLELPLENIVEALLIAAPGPLNIKQLRKGADKGTRTDAIEEAIEKLNSQYQQTGRAFEIVKISEAWQIMTLPEYAHYVGSTVKRGEETRKLSPAMLDSLAIIAYRQPIMRVDIEHIRGVGCGPVLRNLIELGLVKVVGRNTEVIGHPMLYGTTERFLEQFGLSSLDSLPEADDLRQPSTLAEQIQQAAAENGQTTLTTVNHEGDDDSGDEESEDSAEDGAEPETEADEDNADDEDTSEAEPIEAPEENKDLPPAI